MTETLAGQRLYPGPSLAGPENIRLISLFPGTPDDANVVCELLWAELDTTPRYEALSYTLGDDLSDTATAENVVIYLGEAANDSDTAIDFLMDNYSPADEGGKRLTKKSRLY